MAIRSRLKSIVKKALFGSASSTQTTSPAPTPTPSFSQEPVSTTATIDTANPSTSEPLVESTPQTSPEPTTTPPEAQNSDVESQSSTEVDPSEATFVFDVVDLFPDTCPSCDASTHNNWLRIENKFACGSCNSPLTE